MAIVALSVVILVLADIGWYKHGAYASAIH
jgi:hypothetical protein